jgi:hypothetical protein
MLQTYNVFTETTFNIPILSFLIIGIGGLACVLSGYLSQTFGAKQLHLPLCSCLARAVLFSFFCFSVNAVSCLLFLGNGRCC